MLPTRILLSSAVAVLAAAAPASAATVRHVAASGVDGPACLAPAPCKTVEAAVDAAAAGDTVRIGAGVFAGPNALAKPLTLEGAGTAATIVEGGFNVQADTTLRDLRTRDDGSFTVYVPSIAGTDLRLERVTVEGDDTAIEFRSAGGDLVAEDVTLLGTNPVARGLNFAGDDATLRRIATEGVDVAVRQSTGTVAIAESVLRGRAGILAYGASLQVARTRVEAAQQAVDVNPGGGKTIAVAVRDSLLSTTGVGGQPSVAFQVFAYNDDSAVNATLERTTLVARGGGLTRAVVAAANGGAGAVTLRDSVAWAAAGQDAADIEAMKLPVTATHSAFRTTKLALGGTVTAPGSAGNVAAEPGFADAAAGDWSLAPGSPLLDAGDPAALLPADAVDLAGAPRRADADGDGVARTDPGAFERAGATPPDGPETQQPQPPQLSQGDVVAPVVSGVRVALGRRPALRASLSEAARVTVRVVRLRRGAPRRVLARTVMAPAGALRVALRRAGLRRPGRYRVVVRARDAAGNVAAPATRRFRVR